MGDNKILDDLVDHLINGERFFGSYEHIFSKLEERDYTTFTMPSLVDALLKAPRDTTIWKDKIFEREPLYTSSIKVFGMDEHENRLVVYVHSDHYLSNSQNLRKIIVKEQYTKYGKEAHLPTSRFNTLRRLDGATDDLGNRLIWVFDYDDVIRKHKFGSMHIDEAAEHPCIVGALGGYEIAGRYLKRYQETLGQNHIASPNKIKFPTNSIGCFMGIASNGGIMDYLSPIKLKPELIGFEGKTLPNSWEISRIALLILSNSENSEALHDFGRSLGILYKETAKNGFDDVKRQKDPSKGFYREARPLYDDVVKMTERLPFASTEKELFKTKLAELYK